eukprot:jgi/Picsp_1/5644/NSC_03003-R1_hypothetical protein COCSUDRAFT_53521 [Coccomyxa subellipsoidea C-169]
MVHSLNNRTRTNVLIACGVTPKRIAVQWQYVATRYQFPLTGGCLDQSSDNSSSGRRRVAARAVQQGKKGEKGWSEADLYGVHVAVEAPSRSAEGLPLYVTIPGGFLALLTCSRLLGAFMRSRRANALEERGFKRGGAADEDHYNKLMKGVKTVQYDELTEEQMMAARRRRQREVPKDSLDMENLELPENHPFAVNKQVSKEEEELQRQRLLARRGLSAQDMELLRKTQELADQMEDQ